MKRDLKPILMLTLLMVPAGLNASQCAKYLQYPRWVWQTLQWVDNTGETLDIYDATYGWQAQNSDTIGFEAALQFEDLIFSYGELPNGIVGSTIPHTQQENAQCYKKTDYCGLCMDAAVFYYAELVVDPVQISNQYNTYHAEGYVDTYDQVLTAVMSHELGHAMRESDLNLAFSQIQDCTATSTWEPWTSICGAKCISHNNATETRSHLLIVDGCLTARFALRIPTATLAEVVVRVAGKQCW